MRKTKEKKERRADGKINGGNAGQLFLKGMCMGVADVIPGISGGTIAFLLGIYEELISAIKSFDLKFAGFLLKGDFPRAVDSVSWRFLLPLLSGIGCAILLLSRPVSRLLAEHPVFVNSFFFGLILSTVPIVAGAVKKWDPVKISALAVSAAATFFFVKLSPVSTPETLWFVFLSGALAICAMILPGISGAFILLLIGKYQFILTALHSRDIAVIFVFMCGMAAGILSFVRILSWTLRRFHDVTMAALAGIVIGSLNKIWPWKTVVETMITSSGKVIPVREINTLPAPTDSGIFLAIALAVLGYCAAFSLHAVSCRKK